MRVGLGAGAGSGGAIQRVQHTLDSTRYLFLRFSQSTPLRPVLGLLFTLCALLFTLLVRFAHPILAFYVFRSLYHLWEIYYAAKLGDPFRPAFPAVRKRYILTLATLPFAAGVMAAAMVGWAILLCAWRRMRRRGRFGNINGNGHARYEAIPLNVEEVEDLQEEERRKRLQKESPTAPSTPLVPRLFWWALLGVYTAVALYGWHSRYNYELPMDTRFKARVELATRMPRREGYSTGEKVFIAAMFYNNGGMLPYWIPQATKFINYLGPDNVFVSIVESNSNDNTAALLEEFAATLTSLQVPHKITTHDTSIPRPPSMETAPPRIEFLSAVRNLVMEPLLEQGGYTRVFWSNDVFIEAETMAELLHTRDGDYDMVCGLDLAYWGLYDQWVIRDRMGRFASTLWPYFFDETGSAAVMRNEPAPVSACWNGVTAMRADPFLPASQRKGVPAFPVALTEASPSAQSDKRTQPWTLSHNQLPALPLTHPLSPRLANESTPADAPQLRFRSSAKDECFSSESFLLPYDLRRVFGMENILVNPLVICSYSWEFYVYFKWVTRHWAVKWFIEQVENGRGYAQAQMILGGAHRAWVWDGGDCHPW
ncbi:hypothetical protein MKEN_00172400 [Mycena kentingensis (nom. inval.)]|nr:hypothetical protein MKEN_00172400 [Mycena kentingensis (nom. inval.)]